MEYVLDLAAAARFHPDVVLGASPRCDARVVPRGAGARDRDAAAHYVTPDDVKAVAPAVLAHRLVFGAGCRRRRRPRDRRARSSTPSRRRGRNVVHEHRSAAAGGVDARPGSACCCSASTRWRRVRRASTTGWSRSVRSRSRCSSSASCWPIVALRSVDVDVGGPRDATVGDRITLALVITGRVAAPRGAVARSAGRVAAHGRARQRRARAHRRPARRLPRRARRGALGWAARHLPAPPHAVGAPARSGLRSDRARSR